jgi:hypothetical protein
LTTLLINRLRLDGGTQPRAAMDFDAINDYSDAMAEGVKFPPVTVFYDGENYWVADGFHRCRAAFAAGIDEVSCDVRQGTLEDAQWFSFSANKSNGLRRTRDDAQRATMAALAHPQAAGLSDNQIAEHVGVDHKTVAAWREKLHLGIPKSNRRTGRDGRTIDTTKIGTAAKQKVPQLCIIASAAPAEEDVQPELIAPTDGAPIAATNDVTAHTVIGAAESIVLIAETLLDSACGNMRYMAFLSAVEPDRYGEVADRMERAADILKRAAAKLRERVVTPS